MAVVFWDIESFEPPLKSWLTYETDTSVIIDADEQLAQLGNPFVGATVEEFLDWFKTWYHNNRVREFADAFVTVPN